MNLGKITKPIIQGTKWLGNWAKMNSNWLLAAFAALGVFLTAEEAIRATIKAVKICEEKQIKDGKEVIRTVWKLYIPTVGFFLLTTFTICGNAHINARRAATAASLVAMSQADVKAFKEKAAEIIGPKKVEKIEDEVQRDLVTNNPPPAEDKIAKTGHGNDLFYEYLTGQYVRCSPDYINAIQEKMNRCIESDMDNIITVAYYLDLLSCNKDCYIGEAFWDLADMREHGKKEIELDVTSCQWMEVNGKQEMVSTIRPNPLPSGI